MELMNRLKTPIAIVVAAYALAGCANLAEMAIKTNEDTYYRSQDQVLMQNFSILSNDKFRTIKVTQTLADKGYDLTHVQAGIIVYKKKWGSAGNWNLLESRIDAYDNNFENDPIARQYIALCKARGNTVKLYKTNLGAYLNKNYKQYFFLDPDVNTQQWLGKDTVLIEYAKNGDPNSFYTKSHQAISTLGVSVYSYSRIYLKATALDLRNSVPNVQFVNSYVRDL